MADMLVPQTGLQSPPVIALIRQGEAAGMAKHEWVGSKIQPSNLSSASHHASEASGRECRAALCGETTLPAWQVGA